MRGFVIVSVLIAMLLIMPLVIFAQCECTEQSREHIYRGGDDLHLSWYSLQRQEHDGDPTGDPPPIFCYERKVQNRTDQEVTDIYWPIAGYQKKILPAQSLKCCCDSTSVPGPIKQPLPQGPLYYGPGNSHYSTTVYQPRDGWQTRTANFRPMELVAEYPALTSGMQLAIRTSNGEVTVSNVKLQSKLYFITTPEKLYEYLYEFRNVGTEPLYIFFSTVHIFSIK
jgi:hypothetical protein